MRNLNKTWLKQQKEFNQLTKEQNLKEKAKYINELEKKSFDVNMYLMILCKHYLVTKHVSAW